ncbi:phosphatase PAP2 family protein [Spirillospora sp. NPDC047279]|uniref:phosphatase PAP2 family protein n=1 Tax=Spirillospora sp. NPDC047279 TaxID=3155478 RepID=UPI003406F1DF
MQAPEFSADWYRAITGFADGLPSWVHAVAEVGTDAGLLLFAALMVAGWWRARGGAADGMAVALAAPFAVVAAYLVSEVSKTFLREERPCRAVADAVNIAACPAPGDWSFPSNHATIAAASAAALVVAWRTLAPLVLPLAALMAFSRVFVGVHYPHDVAAGFLVGVAVAVPVALLVGRLLAPAVEPVRSLPAGALLLGPPSALLDRPDAPAGRRGRHSGRHAAQRAPRQAVQHPGHHPGYDPAQPSVAAQPAPHPAQHGGQNARRHAAAPHAGEHAEPADVTLPDVMTAPRWNGTHPPT